MDSCQWWEAYKVDVPEGQSGPWRIERFEISKEEADHSNCMAAFSFSGRGTNIQPGKYTKLCRGGVIVMSDTYDEIKDHYSFIREAQGNVIIAGLGLGMVANAVLNKPEVTQATVIELSSDVIQLVGPHWQKKHGDRLKIIQADILQWKPDSKDRWDHAWWDIWDDKCGDNLAQMTKIKRKFAKKVETQACWSESYIRYRQKREKRERHWYFRN